MYISVTGLRLRSSIVLPIFWWHATHSMIQAKRADGNRFADARNVDGVYHTLTAWHDRKAMLVYLGCGAHLRAMRIFDLIGSGRVHGFEAEQVPDWPEALRLWKAYGRDAGV